MSPQIIAAVIAGIVSLAVAVLSFYSNRASTRHEIRQSQFTDVLAKRIELYPLLWKIHIKYETNWVIEDRPKTRSWAHSYFQELNEFNLIGGLFFSQDLYSRFAELRRLLKRAIDETAEDALVDGELTALVRENVYGSPGKPGLSTYEKDDLGSYRDTSLTRRIYEV